MLALRKAGVVVRIWKGWCEAKDRCSYKMAVGMARFSATGGASKAKHPFSIIM